MLKLLTSQSFIISESFAVLIHCFATDNNSALGTTSSTNPSFNALLRSLNFPSSKISATSDLFNLRDRRVVPPPIGGIPTKTSGNPILASKLSAIKIRWQDNAIS